MLIHDKEYTLSEIIYAVRDFNLTGDDFCVYVKNDPDDSLSIENQYLIADYPEVTDDYLEIYPESATCGNFSYCYSGQQFSDVVLLAKSQKPDATIDDYIKVLDYYANNDTFLDL